MTCMCAPTTHAGSFRCRLHRPQQSWGGRPMPCRRPEAEENCDDVSEVTTSTVVRDPSLMPVASRPAPPPKSSSRSPPRGASRLSMVTSSDESGTNDEQMQSVKMATGTGGSFASAPGARHSVFRMLKSGHSTASIQS